MLASWYGYNLHLSQKWEEAVVYKRRKKTYIYKQHQKKKPRSADIFKGFGKENKKY